MEASSQNISRNKVFGSPSSLRIDRGSSWIGMRREVGDGMESQEGESLKTFHYPKQTDTTPRLYSPPLSPKLNDSRASSPVLPYKPITYSMPQMYDVATQVNPLTEEKPKTDGFLLEEKAALKDHLQIQIQVNQELKKLLVASVGDDLGFHYERLATDKARLNLELESCQKRCECQEEEIERLGISCDVWRSKFLASRVQCNDASELKRLHERRQREMESAIRGLLCEHWERSEHLQHIYKTLENIIKSLNKLEKINVESSPSKPDSANLAQSCRSLLNKISVQLVGEKAGISSKKTISEACHNPPSTPAEKYILQLLGKYQRPGSPTCAATSFVPVNSTRTSFNSKCVNRFHSNTVYDNITVNCCNKCKGDIHVV